ncbi:hypothetical protein [Euhalothece natronophila]|nr:hypothetical protein [Euhalothece natronophila]
MELKPLCVYSDWDLVVPQRDRAIIRNGKPESSSFKEGEYQYL